MMSCESVSSETCPACGSQSLDSSIEGIDTICTDCGLVVSSFDLVEGSSDVKNNVRTGSQANEDKGWLEYCSVTNSTEEQIALSLGIMDDYASELCLSVKARIRGSELFGEVAKRNLSHGRSTEHVVGAVLYLAAREVGEVRPLSVIDELTGAENENVKRLTRLLQVELDLEHPGCRPTDYVPFLCDDLGYDDSVRDWAEEILSAAHDSGLVNGRSPTGLAGAALYCASDGEQTQRAVADAAGVSKETIRVRITELREEGIVDD